MQTPETRRCPVCGGNSAEMEPCAICGALPEDGAETAGTAPEETPAAPLPPVPTPARDPEPALPAPDLPPPMIAAGTQGALPAVKYAGFWIRVCAYIGDAIIIQMIIWLLFAVGLFGYTAGSGGVISAGRFYEIYQAQWGSIAGMDFMVKVIYYTLFLGKTGQTPAKKFFGLKVIRTDGAPVTYAQAMIRTLGYYINIFTLEIGFLWVAVDPRKQGLHDKIARTYEIHVGTAGRPEPRFPPVPGPVS